MDLIISDDPDDYEPPETINERVSELLEDIFEANVHLNRDRHLSLVEAYAASIDRHERALRECNQIEGITVIGAKGTPIMHPAVRTARDEAALMTRLAKDLGISPSASIVADTERGEDELENLFSLKQSLSA